MAFGLFRKQVPEPAAPAVGPQVPAAAPETSAEADSAKDSSKEILELLELELGAMIRQLERAASSVADGAEATAAKLATIRARTDALTGRSSDAQSTVGTEPAYQHRRGLISYERGIQFWFMREAKRRLIRLSASRRSVTVRRAMRERSAVCSRHAAVYSRWYLSRRTKSSR